MKQKISSLNADIRADDEDDDDYNEGDVTHSDVI